MNSHSLKYTPLILPMATPLAAGVALDSHAYDLSYQVYQERDDRIRVEAFYLRTQFELNSGTTFKFQYLHDAISGASPTGVLPGGVQPFLADLEDVREGLMGAISHKFGDHTVEFEMSRSSESDYLSYGYALSDTWELNQKNTTISYGLNFVDDQVAVFGLQDQTKRSYDIFAGVTQIIDKNTLVTVNLTLGYSEGYLNDPYKVIQRTDIFSVPNGMGGTIDFPVVNVYSENRPDSRFRQVLQIEGKHYCETPNASLNVMLRLSHDDYDVFSQTLQVEWKQAIGESFIVTPFIRYYNQNAASFFTNTLDDVSVVTPSVFPDGSGPNYSSDYRLSSFAALSLGLRMRYQISDNFAASASYEYYSMSGHGSDQAPSQAYVEADIWTFGFKAEF